MSGSTGRAMRLLQPLSIFIRFFIQVDSRMAPSWPLFFLCTFPCDKIFCVQMNSPNAIFVKKKFSTKKLTAFFTFSLGPDRRRLGCVVHTVPPSVTPTLCEQGGLPVVSLIPVARTEVCPRPTNYPLVCTPRASWSSSIIHLVLSDLLLSYSAVSV